MASPELSRSANLLLDRLCEKPRFAGSSGEAEARAVCRAELEKAGFQCREIPFEYSQWPARWGPPLSALAQAATIVVVARMAMQGSYLAALAVAVTIVGMLVALDDYARKRSVTDFPYLRARSVNLEAKRGNPQVWLVAHLDSKSQTIPMLIRIASSVSLLVLLGLTGVALILAVLGVEQTRTLWPAIQIATALVAIPGVACLVQNRSPGAVDNASGVVSILLAAQSANAPSGLGVLVTSGEELGLAGALAWAASAPTNLRMINCDTIDDRGEWRCMYTGTTNQITEAARALAGRTEPRLRVTRLIPGILADSMAFANRGMASITLSRGTLATLARIHTPGDNRAALNGDGAAEASALICDLAKEIA